MYYQDKKLRHELKYYIHDYDYIGLRTRLRSVMRPDSHSVSDEGYHIRSLYFDDAQDTALFEKNYGVFQRKKYRIRIYNKSDSSIKLERKSKFSEYICKESASFTRQEYEQIRDGQVEVLRLRKEPLVQQFYYGIINYRLEPKVIVDYVREAYITEVGDVRVTFDKSLAAVINSTDIFDPYAIPCDAFHQPVLIMEVKFNQFLPQYISEVLDIPAHNRSAISKYVISREIIKNHYHL